MNKNILAIAIAAAVAAPSAFAAATVYGLAHMSANTADSGAATFNSIASNSSRLGIKGSEDLGAGLKAVYQFETTLGMDGESASGTGFGGQRNSYAGLAGGFGSVNMGIHDTPLKLVGRMFDYFGDQIGDTRTLTNVSSQWDRRPANMIWYSSPSFGGVVLTAGHVVDESPSNASTKTSATSMSAVYKAGKLNVAAAFENHDAGFDANKSNNAYRLGAGYDFGAFNVKAMYANQEFTVGTASKATNVYGIGAGVKVGAAGTIKAQVYAADKLKDVANSGATMYAVGYDHAMSKNTTAYVAYSSTQNEANGTYGVGTTGGYGEGVAASAAGKDPSAFSVGLIHKF